MSNHREQATKYLQWAHTSTDKDGAARFVGMAQVHATLHLAEQVEQLMEVAPDLKEVVGAFDSAVANGIALWNQRR